jgi:hypothetical protein
MNKGIVVSAQQPPKISNELQKQVEAHAVVHMFPNDQRISPKMYGVFYHKQIAGGRPIADARFGL